MRPAPHGAGRSRSGDALLYAPRLKARLRRGPQLGSERYREPALIRTMESRTVRKTSMGWAPTSSPPSI